ncbi:Protein kinase, ATP binding site-containing protein [Cynara cardunculus var. scolymus]|uniref:Protein kinase, ATP binding site-containing protein n=1 Tax=Cynara cardunculus var. scolymus TaxID=59895 RepID=A0A118K1A0_CYNCS|nr:Protein kinase, ATP binding site-containing protein [Cynara cardunculus var. scolymus]
MKPIPIWVFLILLFFLFQSTKSAELDAIDALVSFFEDLSGYFSISSPVSGWIRTSDPCKNNWTGIVCYDQTPSIKSITFESFNLSGTFKPNTICSIASLASSIVVISLNNNNLRGENLEAISNCKKLTHLYISRNQISGILPDSLSHLNNLKKLDISNNAFSGTLSSLPRISGLIEFIAQNNQLSGSIPEFDFSNLATFNVSNNNLSGPIPPGGDLFNATSYLGNPQLCGDPLPNLCETQRATPPSAAQNSSDPKKSGPSSVEILMYSGYVLVGLGLFFVIMIKLCKRKGTKKEELVEEGDYPRSKEEEEDASKTLTFASNEFRSIAMSKSEVFAGNSVESGPVSSSLIVLTSPEVNGLKFEELLKAPAELLGRGKYGSVYKVNCEEQGMTLAVKRIKDWSLPSNDFKLRMKRLNHVKHRNVLPVVAFYCSKQEKLLVYEYQPNGRTPTGQTFDWSSRLGVASTIAEALAFMHDELHRDSIPHGNLKSSNILFNKNMEPCISEYGLMAVDNSDNSPAIDIVNNTSQLNPDQIESGFRLDIHALGVILLELLTGKPSMVQNNGMDLAKWVVSVVKEEWTVEVFDRALIREGASEERMVNLLQIAIKCVDRSPESRPSINQIALMINNIKEEDERSMDVSESPFEIRN